MSGFILYIISVWWSVIISHRTRIKRLNVKYDPDNCGAPLASLGVHEHRNDSGNKQYSEILGKAGGIELISIPDTIVKSLKTVKN
jgi:hypothetical protein